MADKTLLLLDGNSLINRAYYGLLGRHHLTAPDGTPTGAVFAFLNMYLKYIEEIKPTHVAAAFDRKEPTFRHQQFDDYKATRKPMPDDLAVQMPILKDILDHMGIARLEKPGYEADDILGTLARLGSEAGYKVLIVSGDKDSFQLADQSVTIIQPVTRSGKSDTERYDPQSIRERFEIGPEQFVDLKAIMGDPSDNIPGVKGIGEKGATILLKSYDTLDNIYRHLDDLKPAMRKKLEESRDMAYLSRELATICKAVPVDRTVEDLVLQQPDETALTETLSQLGLQRLIERLGLSDKAMPDPIAEQYVLTTGSLDSFESMLSNSVRMPAVLIDEKKQLFYMAEPTKIHHLQPDDLPQALDILNATETVVAWMDYKATLRRLGVKPPACKIHDIVIAAYLLNQSDSRFDLARIYQQVTGKILTDVSGSEPGEQNLSLFDDQPSSESAARDIAATFEIAGKQQALISERKIESLAYDIEMPLAGILAAMEMKGVLVDESKLDLLAGEMDKRLSELEDGIHSKAGQAFNINSPKQLSEVLYQQLGLASGKKSSSGSYSTDSKELERLHDDHPIIPEIIEYRQIAKLKSTFVDGLKKVIDPEDGRVHTTFNQTLTATGRLSSSDPNLQNIPIRMEAGQRIREAFIAAPGHILVNADYSQIELRLLAHLSEDEAMIKAFVEQEDIHTNTACRIFGKPPAQITPDMRAIAKTMNFSIVYGISDYGLARDLGVSIKLAHHYIKEYDQQYPRVRQYLDHLIEIAHKQGFIETMVGRRRYITELKSPNRNLRQFGERAAMNTPIQGTAADLIKIAMVETDRRLKAAKLSAALTLQVHDELIIESTLEEANQAASILQEAMEQAMSLKVPLVAEVHRGKTWAACK